MKSPFKSVSNFFNRERKLLEKPYSELEDLASDSLEIEAAEPKKATEMKEEQFFAQKAAEKPLPYWMQDEAAIRDEGVIFGLTDAGAEEKIKLIESIFEERATASSKDVELLSERIGEYNLAMERIELKIAENKAKRESFEEKELRNHQLPRTIISLVFSLIMAGGNVFLIDHVMKTAFEEKHFFITVGVFFAGMYSLFSGKSFLQHKGQEIDLRRVFQEVLLPLTASFFVFMYALQFMPLGLSVGLFFFVFSLFLYSGKLFLENVSLLKDDLADWRFNQAAVKEKEVSLPNIESTLSSLNEELDAIRIEKWKIIPELSKAEGKVAELMNQKTATIHLFESEFKLARSHRDKLSSVQIKKIIE